MTTRAFDVVIVGAGIAGSACARALAEGGISVAVVDRRPLGRAGARWVNGVPRDAFEDARLTIPYGEELRGGGGSFVCSGPSGRSRVEVNAEGVLEVDMRKLGERLRARAQNAGAVFFDGASVREVLRDGARPIAVRTNDGELHAKLFVDASGIPAILRRAVFADWPDLAEDDLCVAAQEVRAIADPGAATAFLRAHGVRPGATVAWSGVEGGYSILSVRVEHGGEQVALLGGSIAGSARSGAAIVADYARTNPWIGERLFGGAGALPLRRPYARLVSAGLALLGDAACQIFPAHGSGIALGLRAARMLAEAVLAAPTRIGELDTLWPYATRFHREHSGLLIVYDLVRRFSQGLSRDDCERLFDSGLARPATIHAALLQRLASPTGRDVIDLGRAAMRAPRLAARLSTVAARAPLAMAVARRYPDRPDLESLDRYERGVAALVGVAPDPIS